VGGMCSTNGDRNAYRIVVGKTRSKETTKKTKTYVGG
jgi:hypothetical protein